MSRDARIRLEGKLEVFEGAVTTLREAVVRARRGEFRALGAAMDLDVEQVRAQVARVDPSHPQLEEFRRLQTEAASIVQVRAGQMKVPELPVRRALEALVAEPVSYEGVARHPLGPILPVVIGLLVLIEVALIQNPAPLVLHGGVAVYLVIMNWLSPLMRVTSRRMFVGEEVFELADVKSVQIERLMVRSTRPWRLTATLNGGEQVQVRLPYVPEGFTAALHRVRARLPISRTGWAWACF
jgi:hypothetical protein